MSLQLLGVAKSRLGIPASDVSFDDSLNLALSSAQATILGRTRFTAAAIATRTDIRRLVRVGDTLTTSLRPVGSLISVKGRHPANGELSTLTGDLFDAARGKVIVTTGEAFPPVELETRKPPWFQHTNYVWPIVHVEYSVLALPEDAESCIKEAIVDTAIFNHTRGQAGAVASTAGGGSSDTFLEIPLWIEEKIAKYVESVWMV